MIDACRIHRFSEMSSEILTSTHNTRQPVGTIGYGDRIRQAVLDHAARIGRRYSNREFAEDVARAEGRKAYSASAVSEWTAERSQPSIETFKAMAKVTGKSVTWLMALEEPTATTSASGSLGAHAPHAGPMTPNAVHTYTVEELAAHKAAARARRDREAREERRRQGGKKRR